MAAIRDNLCNIGPMEIPRPKCEGFQFITTRGRMGFYRSIKRDGGKYGLKIQSQGPRRPALPDAFIRSTSTESHENGQSLQNQNIPEPPTSAPPRLGSVFQRAQNFEQKDTTSPSAKPPLPPNSRFNGHNVGNNMRYAYNGSFNAQNGQATRPSQSPHGISPLAMHQPPAEPEYTVPEPDYDTSEPTEIIPQPAKSSLSSRSSSISRQSMDSNNGLIEKKIENSMNERNTKVTFVSEKF